MSNGVASAPKRSAPSLVRLLAGVLAAVLVLAGCSTAPDESDALSEPVVAAREQAKAELTAMLDELLNMSTVEKAAGVSFLDTCSEGDDNWKRTDPYRYQCAMALTGFAILTTDPEAELRELDSSIHILGWGTNSVLYQKVLEDPSERGTSCLSGFYDRPGDHLDEWRDQPGYELALNIATPRRSSTGCWDGHFDTQTGFGFWEEETTDIPTWEQIGSPEVALSITVATIYYREPR